MTEMGASAFASWQHGRRHYDLNAGQEAIRRRWSSRKTVYLEGQRDVEIIGLRWFVHYRQYIEFRPPYERGEGCSAVIAAVEAQGPDAYGIVDRDALLKYARYEDFLQFDDEAFRRLNPFGERIFVLSRWEIENFLFDANCLLQVIIARGSVLDKRSKVTESGQVADVVLFEAEILLPVSSAQVVCRQKAGAFTLPTEHGSDKLSLEQMERLVLDVVLSAHIPDAAERDELYRRYLNSVRRFLAAEDATAEAKLPKILRIVDGKRLERRVRRRFSLNDEICLDLADRLVQTNQTPPELAQFVEHILSSAPTRSE